MRTWIRDLHLARSEARKHTQEPSLRMSMGLVGLVAIIGIAFPATGFAGKSDPKANLDPGNNGPAITVLVFNFRQAPPETLLKAEKEAGRILEQAACP
jgi:hypothetical protein